MLCASTDESDECAEECEKNIEEPVVARRGGTRRGLGNGRHAHLFEAGPATEVWPGVGELRGPTIDRFEEIFKRKWGATPAGELAALADSRQVFAEMGVRGRGWRNSLAMVAEEGMREAAMAAGKSEGRARKTWIGWALWGAGVSLLLVELSAGMEYVHAGMQEKLANTLGWLPTLGMLTLNVAEQSMMHWGTLEWVMQAVPMVTLAILLVGAGLVIEARERK